MEKSRFEKHPLLTLSIVTIVLLALIIVIAEIVLRFTVPYDIGYYTAVRKEGVYEYPYGKIYINSGHFPDEEFDLSSAKPRIGYFGDSVMMGVGAGHGYRIGDILRERYPDYEHWTFAMIGGGFPEDGLIRLIDKYDIDIAVYGLNLNDFIPGDVEADIAAAPGEDEITIGKAIGFAAKYLDWMRGKSYLYTVIRTGVKNSLERAGYGYTGFKAIELFPRENESAIAAMAERFNRFERLLDDKGVSLCMIILPYEMQISDEAAQTYRDLGIKWEDGFRQGSTQDIFKKGLRLRHVYDARDAFGQEARQNPAGTYFVYNRGDKIDFNHPNRAGHAAIADGFETARSCPFLR